VGAAATADEDLARGEYLARIMDCSGCHTSGALRGLPDFSRNLGGADISIATPLGKFFGTNLTPEPETGLGCWTIDDIVAALSDENTHVLALYLKSLPPVSTPPLGPYGLDEPVPTPYLAPVLPE